MRMKSCFKKLFWKISAMFPDGTVTTIQISSYFHSDLSDTDLQTFQTSCFLHLHNDPIHQNTGLQTSMPQQSSSTQEMKTQISSTTAFT